MCGVHESGMTDRHRDRREYMRRFMWAKRHAADDEKETPKDAKTEVKGLANTEDAEAEEHSPRGSEKR